MNIAMVGLDYEKAPIELRERLSFTRSGVLEILGRMKEAPNVLGVVLLSTCNRTELYLSYEGEDMNPGVLLCTYAGVSYGDFAQAFVCREGEDCIHHLMEVSCGLKSQILGEDQILAQVKTAEQLAREGKTIDPILGTLFRLATSCGKQVKTQIRFTGVATSAAHSGVLAIGEQFGSLLGKKALVIGNGEMGRLTAELLVAGGAKVWVTIRSYRHGAAVVPRGCSVVSYDDRYQAMEGMDVVVSATTSPHHTVVREQMEQLKKQPKLLVDLSIPRDIDPACTLMAPILNVDDLGKHTGMDGETQENIRQIMEEHEEKFRHWRQFRDCMPAVEELKEAILGRVQGMEGQESALKTVDMLMGGLAECLTPEKLRQCAQGIRDRNR